MTICVHKVYTMLLVKDVSNSLCSTTQQGVSGVITVQSCHVEGPLGIRNNPESSVDHLARQSLP